MNISSVVPSSDTATDTMTDFEKVDRVRRSSADTCLFWLPNLPPNSPDIHPVDYEVCSVSSRSGVASTRTSLTEQFDSSGVFDYAHVSVQTAATLSTNCN